MTTLQYGPSRNGILCFQLGIKLVLERNQVGALCDCGNFFKPLGIDIYVVADAEGNQMVLKIHR